MTPEQAFDLVHAYADGELDAASVLEFESHLAMSPALRKEHASIAALQASIRHGVMRYSPPPRLEQNIRTASSTESNNPWRATGRWRPLALSASAAAVLLLAWNLSLTLPRAGDEAPDEIISAHFRSLQADHLTDIASSDRHTVKPWLSQRLHFSPIVGDFANAGFPLVGARLDYLKQNSVAAIVYKHRQHVINVFVWPTTGDQASKPEVHRRRGHNMVRFDVAGMGYWAVSDLNTDDLGKLVGLLQSVAEPRPTNALPQ